MHRHLRPGATRRSHGLDAADLYTLDGYKRGTTDRYEQRTMPPRAEPSRLMIRRYASCAGVAVRTETGF